MNARALPIVLSDLGVSYTHRYDTIIVNGDLYLDQYGGPIEMKCDQLWVKGRLVIKDCPMISELPIENIEANSIIIENNTALTRWPNQIFAREAVELSNNGGIENLRHTKIFADTLSSDAPYHQPDYLNVFGYYINLDERGEFYADVRNRDGDSIFEINTEAARELIDDGFVRDPRKIEEVYQYLVGLGIVKSTDRLLLGSDAEEMWTESDKEYFGSKVAITAAQGA